MSEKPQFDSSVGGHVELPLAVSYLKYAAARSKEIEYLRKTVTSSTGSKLIFQKLPKHMRRRAMSHNSKRLPRRLRQIHQNQLEKSGMPQKQKKSRKFRRRPNNMEQEFARRQKHRFWLNTHLWHAKRFHMIEKWGYKLPNRPCDKGFRACYRATAKHCLIQDISYYSCIQIEGNYFYIVDKLKLITNKDYGLTIGARALGKGNKEGSITLFKLDQSKKPIGEVYFIWKPTNGEFENRFLWLWIHAAFYNEVLETFLELFSLEQVEDVSIPEYVNPLHCTHLKELKRELNRFRLTGPLSNAVIQNCFKIVDTNKFSPSCTWFQNYLQNDEYRQIFVSQSNFWSSLKGKSHTSVPPYSVLSVIVEDPRINFPKKRTKCAMDYTDSSYINPPLIDVCFSELWNESVRICVSDNKVSNAKICEMRSKLLVPGSDLEDETLRVPIPLIFTQRPGSREENLGYSGGWDIILPASWAQPLWISLIMWGARAGGLRETKTISFELGKQFLLLPDTNAGKKEEEEISTKCKEAYFRKPPNRRTNYNKLSMSCPYEWNWKMLIRDWKPNGGEVVDFSVLRNIQKLIFIQKSLSKRKPFDYPELYSEDILVPVKLTCISKGLPMKFGVICLPQPEDYKNVPVEPLKKDINEKERKELRRSHKTLLKRLRQRRVRAKRTGQEIPIDKDMLHNYQSKMRKLWVPTPKEIRNSCSREVIGLIRYGNFSFSLAKGSAIGYIAIGAVEQLFKLKNRRVLIRNPNSRQYRFAVLDVICN